MCYLYKGMPSKIFYASFNVPSKIFYASFNSKILRIPGQLLVWPVTITGVYFLSIRMKI